jgi:predicted ATPase
VTFLFTDIEGSTRAWEEQPDEMRDLVARHDEIVRGEIGAHHGYVFATGGDGFAAAFARAADAVDAARAAQTELARLDGIAVRMGINTGEAHERGGDYFGPAVNRAARIMAAGHGRQVLVAAVTAEVVGAADLQHLGQHRLRDLSQPMSIFQLGTDRFPALRTLDAAPSNLPFQLTSFVGRDAEIEALTRLLHEHRVVTITGVGGAGKTRLAMHVAAELLPDQPDGVWLVELASVDSKESMEEAVAAACNISVGVNASLTDAIIEAIRRKRMLLLLDNCEHLLLDAADLVDAIATRCEGLRVLATSREGLGVDGERVWPLRPLSVPPAGQPADLIETNGAVQLLIDRAQAVAPSFALDERNAGAIVEICRRLDGIPLAIELAAARLASMQPQDIAAHLDERFRLLTGGRRRGIERHQTLRAAVDWSYSLLAERERQIFDRLSVFAGGFDAAAAQAVVADVGFDRLDVLDALDELVAKSMVVAERGVSIETRYALLETLRQYGLERLDARGAADATRRSHAEHYASFAEHVAPKLLSRHELEWRPKINAEIDNFRAAVTWTLDRDDPHDAELAMRIIAALAVEAVFNRGAGIGGWAEQAVTSTIAVASPHQPTVLIAAGYGAFHRLAPELAMEYIERAGATPATPIQFAMAAGIRANAAQQTGSGMTEAAATQRAAFRALTGDDDESRAARLLLCPAPIYNAFAGDPTDARAMAEQLVADARVLGQPTGLCMALYAEGYVLWHLGAHPTDSAEALEESIALTRAGASDVVLAQALNTLALHHSASARHHAATSSLRESIRHSTNAGDHVANCSSLEIAAVILARIGDTDAALSVGSSQSGFLAARGYDVVVLPGAQSVIAELETRVGQAHWAELTALGAAMDYDELLTAVIAALDRAREAFADAASGDGRPA